MKLKEVIKEMSDYQERKKARKKHFEKNVKGWKLEKCPACAGTGRYDSDNSPKCSACDGTGKIRVKPKK